jgi:hypothetical protein
MGDARWLNTLSHPAKTLGELVAAHRKATSPHCLVNEDVDSLAPTDRLELDFCSDT